jgi:hypothetical protein
MDQWQAAGQGWEGCWSEVRLAGWTARRRVIILRRPLREELVVAKRKGKSRRQAQMELEMGFLKEGTVLYEHAVLVTNMEEDIFTLAQHYRDRGDAENAFDELKNQWGWLGYTTHDHARSEMMTLFVALVYHWWSLFTRLSFPHKRAEAITSRPLLLHAIGRKTSHSNQSTLTLTSLHAEAATIQVAMKAVAGFLGHLARFNHGAVEVYRTVEVDSSRCGTRVSSQTGDENANGGIPDGTITVLNRPF